MLEFHLNEEKVKEAVIRHPKFSNERKRHLKRLGKKETISITLKYLKMVMAAFWYINGPNLMPRKMQLSISHALPVKAISKSPTYGDIRKPV